MTYYNSERTNQGKHCQSKTPRMAFIEGLELYGKYVYEYNMEEMEENEETR